MNDIPEYMHAAVHNLYGEPEHLTIERVPVPAVKEDEYLIQVHAVALNPADWKYLEGRWRFFTGNRFPRTVGIEFSGVVAHAGAHAREYAKGDAVFGSINAFRTGAAAEYVAASAHSLAAKPENVPFHVAAAIPIAGGTVFMGFRNEHRDLHGKQVLITGAGGGVGHLAVQFAHMLGAHVTAVCSGEKSQYVEGLGAQQVIDYTRDDVAHSGHSFDIIFDCAGSVGWKGSKALLEDGGEYLLLEIAGKLWLFVASWFSQRFARKKMRTYLAHPSATRAAKLATLFGSGALDMTVDARFPLSEISDALRLLKNGHAKGKIVVDIIS